MSRDANRGWWRPTLAATSVVLAALFVLVFRQVLGVSQHDSWPPPPDAVTAAGALAATEAFAARDGVRPHDAALDFAWSTAATIDPWPEGKNFFPRIFADVEAATSSVHILLFGWREGEVGREMARLLERKLAQGVEVRVLVDRYGSRPYKEAQEMFRQLAAAGAQIVVNDVFPVDQDGLYPRRAVPGTARLALPRTFGKPGDVRDGATARSCSVVKGASPSRTRLERPLDAAGASARALTRGPSRGGCRPRPS
jgi:cardiolipin synthase